MVTFLSIDTSTYLCIQRLHHYLQPLQSLFSSDLVGIYYGHLFGDILFCIARNLGDFQIEHHVVGRTGGWYMRFDTQSVFTWRWVSLRPVSMYMIQDRGAVAPRARQTARCRPCRTAIRSHLHVVIWMHVAHVLYFLFSPGRLKGCAGFPNLDFRQRDLHERAYIYTHNSLDCLFTNERTFL